MKCVHAMPFGAELRADGSVRFRLFAPVAKQVDLVLEAARGSGARETLPMSRLQDGFFERVTTNASAGSRYRYRIDDRLEVPDPASRSNPDDPAGPSEVIDPAAFEWNEVWFGRPWHEAVIYELHVGTFTNAGTFASAIDRLPYLAALGVTAIELMPLADFPGRRGWGYDGVLPFAPDASYGTPDDLKRLIRSAHALGLMVFLDVVYNHFGPEGNYLHAYAPSFFSDRHHTLWGPAINFDGEGSRPVRNFFIHNTLYWLEECRLDGLRFDAVNAIRDASRPHILEEIAAAAHAGSGRTRTIHLVLENDDNAARYLRPREAALYRAQWNDDAHHAFHALATGETDGYYADYTPRPIEHLARALAEGFDYQGEVSAFRGRPRGEPSAGLPPIAFVNFLQNHDQIGNRAFGERITALAPVRVVRCLTAILLLAPQPPLMFMGQEYGAATPFQFFCDFGPELGAAVARGRREEFARFMSFADEQKLARLPDPNDKATFVRSRLDWRELDAAEHAAWHDFHRSLLALRHRHIVPLVPSLSGNSGKAHLFADAALEVVWSGEGEQLTLLANLGDVAVAAPHVP
ncbi:MAG TPA: malto-oligosyltrehalose trehalohydrolase, partial [Actinomycetota bacterium]|nr:malto-oligosyltrehalose trehalohydrolase [Actinomycetota bacterium]